MRSLIVSNRPHPRPLLRGEGIKLMNSRFIFKKHEFSPEQGRAKFYYELQAPDQNYNFVETLLFPRPPGRSPALRVPSGSKTDHPPEGLSPFLNSLHLILGISYWKTFCPKKIETPAIQLTKEQADFWNTVYTKGLGEFFYKNKIDYRGLVKFPYEAMSNRPHPNPLLKGEGIKRSLLLFGGGKDSIVAAQMLKKEKKQFTLLQINTSDVQEETAKIVGAGRIVLKRKLDPKLLELNKKPGIYNGHVPVTAIWEFFGLFAAALYGYSNVISSNEKSADYGNVKYLGEEINHQWSKSSEFEKLLLEYTKKYINPEITVFSILRQFNELQIIEKFVKYPQYFLHFSSCNRNFRIVQDDKKRWCGECPKCLFVFILLSAFLSTEQVVAIFGSNLLNHDGLLPILKQLLGLEKTKPFECVGTPQEVRSALYLAYKKNEYNTDILMRFFIEKIMN